MASFELDMTRFIDKLFDEGAKVDQVVRKVVFEVGSSLVMKSPVDTGRFRANWQHGTATAPEGELDRTDRDGGATISLIARSIPRDASRHVHFLANNLPYGPALERGHSKQAPQGMVGVTLVEYQDYVNRAVGSTR